MWFKFISFLKFLVKSNNHHGIHSPFVYDLITRCFYTKTKIEQIQLFRRIRKSLFTNNTVIEITDFGQGSKIFKGNKRVVSEIAKIAGINKKKAYLLIRIVDYLKPKNILEIGTSVGLGTAALSIANGNTSITSLEGCSNTATIALNLFKRYNLDHIKVQIGKFNDTMPLAVKEANFDLIYFDGNHEKSATLNYFEQCLPTAKNNSVFIFDDINWSYDMQLAWEEIKNHDKVTVTINTFFWGIVFFRTEQRKQHFTVRV